MQVTTEIDTADFQKKLEPVYKQYGEKFADLITSIKNTK
jgi:hypothetical protein